MLIIFSTKREVKVLKGAKIEYTIEDIINKMKNNNKKTDIKLITKAYNFAKKKHGEQLRKSGEPYIIHPVQVAYTLAELGLDDQSICAALLHDVVEDTPVTHQDLIKEFGLEIAEMVDGVTKLAKMNFSSKEEQNLANTRKIITSITSDVRIIIIKLADRLHNMRTLEYKSEFKQKENAVETMEIFVPLAYYIGAYRIKSELEDLSFRYLMPDMYKKIGEIKLNAEKENNQCLSEMLFKIQTMLNDRNIPNEIKQRTKNIYGIYKRLNDGKKVSDIHDLFALKIMVDEVENCYRGLYCVHSLYNPMNDRFKDYVCNPKTNMYRSLHTTVFGPNNTKVQTQIRTFDMDTIASFGLTAYWDIMKGNVRDIMQEDLRQGYQFFRSLTEINAMFGDNKEFVSQVKKELFGDRVYVYTTKGDTIELPKGSTPIDFAYKIHTDVGNTMVAAIVNDEYVELDYKLRNKDRVRIITDELSFGPREDWIDKAHTCYAKKKIMEVSKNRIMR